MLVFIWALLIGACCAGTIDVKLEANWQRTPFKLNVLEAVSNYNETLYQPLVEKLMGVERDETDTQELSFADESGYAVVSDADFFDFAMKLIPSSEFQRLVEIEIANKVYSARVAAHYNYYETDVRDKNKCVDDFVLFEANSDNLYCESDAAFVLKTINDPMDISEVKLEIDHILGSVFNRKIYTIYGDFENPTFRSMFFNMYQLVVQDKLTLLWRYVSGTGNIENEFLSGYAAEIQIKKPDSTLVEDDNNIADKRQRILTVEPVTLSSEQELSNQKYDKIKEVKHFQLLGIQATHFILNAKDKFKTLFDSISEFPKYAYFISSQDTDIAELRNIEMLAKEMQSLNFPTGIYINGAFIPAVKMNFFEVINSIKRELGFVNMFSKFGISIQQSREIMASFANTVAQNFNPNKLRYNTTPFHKIIGYINDIELDSRYKDFISTKKAYSKPVSPGKLPFAKENIFDMIFVFDLANNLQLQYFMDCAARVLEHKYPIRIGVVPLRDVSEYSEMATSKFFGALKTQGPSEAFTFLNMFNMFINSKEGLNRMTFRAMHAPYIEDEDKETVYSWLDEFYKTFDIKQDHPLIIADGVLFSYNDINSALKQIFSDMNELYDDFMENNIPTDVKFKDYVRRDALDAKNTKAVPSFLGDFRSTYAPVPDPLLYAYGRDLISLIIDSNVKENETPLSLNFVGSLENEHFRQQLKEAVEFVERYKNPLRVNIWDLSGSASLNELSGLPLSVLKERLKSIKVGNINDDLLISLKAYLYSFFGLRSFNKETIEIFVAGRHISLRTSLNSRGLESLAKFELTSRLNGAASIAEKHNFNFSFDTEFERHDFIAWAISSTYFYPDKEHYFSEAVPRLDTGILPKKLSVSSLPASNLSDSKIHVELIIDTVSEQAQKIVSFVPFLQSLNFVDLTIHLSPLPVIEAETLPINRFYKGLYLTTVDFESDYHIAFANVPEKTQFNIGTDVPQRWLASNKESSADMNHVSFNTTLVPGGNVSAVFELKHILVEGYANGEFKSEEIVSPAGLGLELINSASETDTLIMATYGYFQLQANPGLYKFQLKKGTRGDDIYENIGPQNVWVTSLDGHIMKPVIVKKPGQELNSIIRTVDSKLVDSSFVSHLWGAVSSLLNSNTYKKPQADINIFTITSGNFEERQLAVMIASVVKNTGHSVKFWFLENYLSPDITTKLFSLSQHYGFEYEFLMYKWPVWLKPQSERQRIISGFKVLFLDVLFPQDLSKIIFVDPDQVVRTDLYELVNEDLHGAPYAYVPMCDSRVGREEFRYWKNEYWQKILGGNLTYHNSALSVIDLDRFREIGGGDIIRQHYQRLSANPKALKTLDQDLPNSLQEYLPIHSLDKSWLWCETLCNVDSFEDAKIIGLCQNILIREPTLENAQKRANEWNALDIEVLSVFEEKTDEPNIEHDEL